MPKTKCRVVFFDDSIVIVDDKGPVVTWVPDEWIKDPSVVPSIANGTYLAGKGVDIRRKIARGKARRKHECTLWRNK